MDQILFIFDLDQLLPVEGDSVEEESQEARLNCVKQACLRILLYGRSRLNPKHRDLPHFGYRFYSSTDFNQTPEQISGSFLELNLERLGDLESALDDRFRCVIQNSWMEAGRNNKYFSTYLKSTGHKTGSENLRSCLEDVTLLFDWDRPKMHSPLKKVSESEGGLGNCVFLFTKVPRTKEELQQFLPPGAKTCSHREISNQIFTKKVRSAFSGELSITFHLVDTSHFHTDLPFGSDTPSTEFLKSIKEVGGAVIPVQTLTDCDPAHGRVGTLLLQPGSVNNCPLPPSLVLRSYLQGAHSRTEHKSYKLVIAFGEHSVGLESLDKAPVELGALRCQGYMIKSLWNLKLRPAARYSVSASDDKGRSVLTYILETNRLAVLRTEAEQSLLLLPESQLTGQLQILSTADSNFLAFLLRLKRLHVPGLLLPSGAEQLLLDETNLPAPPYTDPVQPVRGSWDVNSLEKWRLPDPPSLTLQKKLKEREVLLRKERTERLSLLRPVRDYFIARGSVYVRPSGGGDVLDQEQSLRTEGQDRRIELKKHCSEMSSCSSASRSSRSSGISRGEVLRQMEEEKEKRRRSLTDMETKNQYSEVTLDSKANQAKELLEQFLGAVDLKQEKELVLLLREHKRRLVETEEQNYLGLASFAEACVSLVLQHLNQNIANKTNFEELVSTHLLLDPPAVAQLYSVNKLYRINEHKVQILLRSEVHWFLANKNTASAFQDSIIDHLRQISVYGSPKIVSDLLQVLLHLHVKTQPELLGPIYDELDLDRPEELGQLFSPGPRSGAPSSNNSLVSSASPSSSTLVQEVQAKVSRKIPLARPKSFDANLNRQINISKGGLRRNHSKAGQLSFPVTKVMGKEKGRSGAAARKLSSKKKVISSALHKSPRKSVQQARRNLCFDKSPRKRVDTPKKLKMTPQKFTPGKRHRVMVPDTPVAKLTRKKSDGNRSIGETPEKTNLVSVLNSTFESSQFYSNNRSRNSVQYTGSMQSSHIFNNSSFLLQRENSVESLGTKRSSIFSHILPMKRKRESPDSENPRWSSKAPRVDSVEGLKRLDSMEDLVSLDSSDEPALRRKTALEESRTRRRRISFSMDSHIEFQESSLQVSPGPSKLPGLENESPELKNRSVSRTSQLDTMFLSPRQVGFGSGPERTPNKVEVPGTPLRYNSATKGGHGGRKNLSFQETPRNSEDSEDCSPAKKVSFNPKVIQGTPKRPGFHAKKILKTPSKTTPFKDMLSQSSRETRVTPSKAPLTARYETPRKSPGRKDILASPRRLINLTACTVRVQACSSSPVTLINLDEGPGSPIIRSSSKRNRSGSVTPEPQELEEAASPIIFSPRARSCQVTRGRSPLLDKFVSVNLINVVSAIKVYTRGSSEDEPSTEVSSYATAPKTPTKVELSLADVLEFTSPQKKHGRKSVEISTFRAEPQQPRDDQLFTKGEQSVLAEKSARPKTSKKELLDDQLSTYFSPKCGKRQVNRPLDVKNNHAIVSALMEHKHDPARRKLKRKLLKCSEDSSSRLDEEASPDKKRRSSLDGLEDTPDTRFNSTPQERISRTSPRKYQRSRSEIPAAMLPRVDASDRRDAEGRVRMSPGKVSAGPPTVDRGDREEDSVKVSSRRLSRVRTSFNIPPESRTEEKTNGTIETDGSGSRGMGKHESVLGGRRVSELTGLHDSLSAYYSADTKRRRTSRQLGRETELEDRDKSDIGKLEQNRRPVRTSGPSLTELAESERLKQSALANKDIPDISSPHRFRCAHCSARFRSKTKFRSHEKSCLAEIEKPAQGGSGENSSEQEDPLRGDEEYRGTPSAVHQTASFQTPAKVFDEGLWDDLTPSRRSGRSRAPVSYEEPLDFSAETSPEPNSVPSSPVPGQKKKYLLGCAISPGRSKSTLSHLSSRGRSKSSLPTSPSVKSHFRESKKKSRLKVKTINNSSPMTDLTEESESTGSSQEESESPCSTRYGKFTTMVEESLGGAFKVRLNRVKKSRQGAKPHTRGVYTPASHYTPASRINYTPASSTHYTPASSTNYTPASGTHYTQASSTHYTPASSTNYTPASGTHYTQASSTHYLLPRVSRRLSKDIGISPQKIIRIITESPQREVKKPKRDRKEKPTDTPGKWTDDQHGRTSGERTEAPEEVGTPGKENQCVGRGGGGTPLTPKIRIRRVGSTDPLKPHVRDAWKVSPVKSVPISPDQFGSSPDRPSSSPDRCRDGEAAHLFRSPGLKGGSFSPLSSLSLHKLKTSPLVSFKLQKESSFSSNGLKKKSRVNKQLY